MGLGRYQGGSVTRLWASLWGHKHPVSSATILGGCRQPFPSPGAPRPPQRAPPDKRTASWAETPTWLPCPPPGSPPSTPTGLGPLCQREAGSVPNLPAFSPDQRADPLGGQQGRGRWSAPPHVQTPHLSDLWLRNQETVNPDDSKLPRASDLARAPHGGGGGALCSPPRLRRGPPVSVLLGQVTMLSGQEQGPQLRRPQPAQDHVSGCLGLLSPEQQLRGFSPVLGQLGLPGLGTLSSQTEEALTLKTGRCPLPLGGPDTAPRPAPGPRATPALPQHTQPRGAGPSQAGPPCPGHPATRPSRPLLLLPPQLSLVPRRTSFPLLSGHPLARKLREHSTGHGKAPPQGLRQHPHPSPTSPSNAPAQPPRPRPRSKSSPPARGSSRPLAGVRGSWGDCGRRPASSTAFSGGPQASSTPSVRAHPRHLCQLVTRTQPASPRPCTPWGHAPPQPPSPPALRGGTPPVPDTSGAPTPAPEDPHPGRRSKSAEPRRPARPSGCPGPAAPRPARPHPPAPGRGPPGQRARFRAADARPRRTMGPLSALPPPQRALFRASRRLGFQ